MSEILVNTIKKADGTGGLTVPTGTGDIVTTGGTTFTGEVTGTDLTLSGGVYLGGTGAANYLDDYEEGTWTPYFTSTGGGSATMGGATEGVYVKTGNVVYVHANLEMTTNSLNSGGMEVRGLPFTPSGTSSYRNGTAFFSYTVNVVPQPFGGTFNTGWNYLQLWNQGNNSTYQATNWDNGGRAVFSGFYFTT